MIRRFSVKTTVFTMLAAGLMAVGGCQGPAGPAGEAGEKGDDALESVPGLHQIVKKKIGKVCTEFAYEGFAEKTEVNLLKRKAVVTAVDGKLTDIPNMTIQDQYGDDKDEKHCFLDLEIYDGHLNKVVFSKTRGSGSFTIYINGKGDFTHGETETMYKNRMSALSTYLEDANKYHVYDLRVMSPDDLRAFYIDAAANSDFKNVDENGDLAVESRDAVMDYMQAGGAVYLQKMVVEGANSCVKPALDADRPTVELEISGGTYTVNGDLGTNSAGQDLAANYFQSINATSGQDGCIVDTMWGVLVGDLNDNGTIDSSENDAYVLSGTTVDSSYASTTCFTVDYDNKYDGLFGKKTAIDTSLDGYWGSIILSNGTDERDTSETSHVYIPAVLSLAALKTSTSASADTSADAGDGQNWFFANNLFSGVDSSLIAISNEPKNFPLAGVDFNGSDDADTEWLIFAATPAANVFIEAANDTYAFADGDTYRTHDLNITSDVLLAQDCKPSKKTEFQNVISGNHTRIGHKINKAVTITEKDETENLMLLSALMMVYMDSSDADTIVDIIDVASQQLEGHPALQRLFHKDDLLDSAGVLAIGTVQLAKMIAQTRAFCFADLLNLHGGDDQVLLEWDNDGNIDKYYTSRDAKPNVVVAGLSPRDEYTVSTDNTQKSDLRASQYGIGVFDVISDPDGTIPDTIKVTSGGQEIEIPCVAK